MTTLLTDARLEVLRRRLAVAGAGGSPAAHPATAEAAAPAGLTVAELACRQGTPPQGPRTTIDQRFVDETA